jgi:putative PEP-CTERM system TPR-repeat lipoprotein
VYAPNLPETLLQRARVFQLEGDFQSAGRELTKLFNREPDDLRIMFALAANQWRAGNIYQAQDYLTRIVTLSPENTRAKRLLAQVQLQQKNTNLAVEILEPMLAQNSGDAELLGLLAIADMQRGQTGLALDHLRTATELDPENTGAAIQLAEGYVIAGNPENAVEILVGLPVSSLAPFSREKVLLSAYRDLGRLDEARALVAGLVDDHGNNFEALQLAARFYVNIKEYGEGREILQQLIQISPRSSQAKLMLAKLDLTQSRQASASKHFQDVFEDDSTNLTAILGLVQIALENGETGQALGLLERAVSLHPLEPVPALVLADLYLRGGRAQDAVMIAESLADLKFDDVGVVRSVGRVFFEAGHLQQAQEQFAIAVAREPGSVALMLDLTRALMSSGNYAEALDVSQQAIDVDPTSMPARILQVLTMIRLGQLDAAHERAIALVKDRPDDPAAALARAEVLAAREDYSNAVQAFRDAAEKGAGLNAVLRETQVRMAWGADEVPEFPLVDWIDGHGGDYEAKKSLAEIYQQQGKRDAARGTYIELLVDAPDDPVVLNNLAVELQLVGDLARALRHAQRANKLNPHSGAIADTLGWIYRDMGDHQNSIKFLREANRLLPGNKDVLYHLAAALADAGVTGEAREILINILQAPGSFASLAEAEKLLASL